MDLQDRYDELDNIITSIRLLTSHLTDKNYIEQLEIIQFQAEDDLEEIEKLLQEQYDREEKEQEREFYYSRI